MGDEADEGDGERTASHRVLQERPLQIGSGDLSWVGRPSAEGISSLLLKTGILSSTTGTVGPTVTSGSLNSSCRGVLVARSEIDLLL